MLDAIKFMADAPGSFVLSIGAHSFSMTRAQAVHLQAVIRTVIVAQDANVMITTQEDAVAAIFALRQAEKALLSAREATARSRQNAAQLQLVGI